MSIDVMKIRELCNDGLRAAKYKYPALAEEAFERIKQEIRRNAADADELPIVKLAAASPALYAWLHSCPWEELAAVLMAYEEDDSASWLKGKRTAWPALFRDGLTMEHFGDCTKAPTTCLRCMAESFKKKIDALRAAVA